LIAAIVTTQLRAPLDKQAQSANKA